MGGNNPLLRLAQGAGHDLAEARDEVIGSFADGNHAFDDIQTLHLSDRSFHMVRASFIGRKLSRNRIDAFGKVKIRRITVQVHVNDRLTFVGGSLPVKIGHNKQNQNEAENR